VRAAGCEVTGDKDEIIAQIEKMVHQQLVG
jgi:hypothetical protein